MKPITIKPIQPEGSATCMTFGWGTNRGKVSRSSGYRHAEAYITKPIRRYSCAHTVGNGFSKWHVGTDQPGAKCYVYGAFSDGRLIVVLPGGGYGVLGTSDVRIANTAELTDEECAFLFALPAETTLDGEELTQEVRHA